VLADEADSSVVAAPTASSRKTTKTGNVAERFGVEYQQVSWYTSAYIYIYIKHGRPQVLVSLDLSAATSHHDAA
jgi:hypothetical protein